MAQIHYICDYVLLRAETAEASMNLLKLQKLLYYVQAWHIAFESKPLFDGRFQAWVHGPVNRAIYDRFSASKSLYSTVGMESVTAGFDSNSLADEERFHIDTVLESYLKFTGTQLEELTHREDPWIEARKGYEDFERCEVEISEETMGRFYAARLNG